MSPPKTHPPHQERSNPNNKPPKKNPPTPETPPHPHPKLPQSKEFKSLLVEPTSNPATAAFNPHLQIAPSLPTTRKYQQELITDLYLTFPELVFISNRLSPSAHKPLFLEQTTYQPPHPSPQANAKSNHPAKPTNVGIKRQPPPLSTIQETELEEKAHHNPTKPQRRNDQENHRGGFQRHETSRHNYYRSNGYPRSRSTPFKQPTLMEALKLEAGKSKSEFLTSFVNNRKKWPSWSKTGYGD